MQKRFYLILILVLSIGVTIGLSLNVSAQPTSIPSWVKSTAKYWVNGDVGDADFIKAIQWMVTNGIIVLPNTSQSAGSNPSISSTSNSLSVLLPTAKDVGDFWKIHDATSTTVFSDISPSIPVYNIKGEVVDSDKGQPKYVLEQIFEKSTTPLSTSRLTVDIASFTNPGDLTTYYLSDTRDLYSKAVNNYKKTHNAFQELTFVPTIAHNDISCAYYSSGTTQSSAYDLICNKRSVVFMIHAVGNDVGIQDDIQSFADNILKKIG